MIAIPPPQDLSDFTAEVSVRYNVGVRPHITVTVERIAVSVTVAIFFLVLFRLKAPRDLITHM
jgi:hypothetical protein